MKGAVRPIHLPGAAALESLRQRAQAALDAWAREWISPWTSGDHIATLQICSAVAATETNANEYEVVRAAAGAIWFRSGVNDISTFGHAIICADEWIADVVDAAWAARNRALCTALVGVPVSKDGRSTSLNALPANLFEFGSGAVQLSCDSLGLYAIVDDAVWRDTPPGERAVAQRRPKVTPVDKAALRAQVRLDVMLGSVEVELPKLLELRRDDVLRLPRQLNEGLTLLCAGKPLARVALGEQQGRKCVQIVSSQQ